jgi:hypothetical protein
MKRILFCLISLFLIYSTASSQDFTFQRLGPSIIQFPTGTDTMVQIQAITKNNTSNTYNFRFARIVNDLPSGWFTSMCYELCYTSTVDTIPPPPMTPYNLDSNHVDTNFYIDFDCQGDGLGTAIVRMYEEGNPTNFAQDTFKVLVGQIGIQNISSIAEDYLLGQNYPNPFNPNTTIEFSLPKKESVRLVVYDVLGNEVTSLINNELLNKGRYNFVFNADSYNLSSGVFIYKLSTPNFTQIKKMILIK